MKNFKQIYKFIGCASIVIFSIIASTAHANCFKGEVVIDKSYSRWGQYVWLFTNGCNKTIQVFVYEGSIMVQTTYLTPGQSQTLSGGNIHDQRWTSTVRN